MSKAHKFPQEYRDDPVYQKLYQENLRLKKEKQELTVQNNRLDLDGQHQTRQKEKLDESNKLMTLQIRELVEQIIELQNQSQNNSSYHNW